MLSYSRTFLKSLRIIALKVQFLPFAHSVRNRFQRLIKKGNGHHKKHRAGWWVALRRRPINRMTIPSVISSNVRSLMGKFNEVKNLTHETRWKNVGAILLQETWLHSDIDDDIIGLDGFNIFRSDRPVNFRNRGGGVVTFISRSWCDNSQILFNYSTGKINCIFVRCKPRFISKFHFIVLVNIYISPDTPTPEVALFADTLSTQFATYIDHSLCIAAGDFNRFDTSFLSTLGLVNLVHFPTRLHAQLDCFYVNNPNLFHICKQALIGTSDHCSIFLHPKVYSKFNHTAYTKSVSRTLKKRNCCPDNLDKLRNLVSSTDFSVFSNDHNVFDCEHLTDYLNFCYDQCCPIETVYVYSDRFSSPLLKRLRREKEKAYKTGMRTIVKRLSVLIRIEVRRLNKIYVDTVLGNKSCREMWSALRGLCGT